MDIDAFVASHQATWWRLQALNEQARKLKSMSPEELDEMVMLYQRSGAHLAHARVTYAFDPALVSRLTLLVSEAHGLLYGQRDTEIRRSVATFAATTFPAAIWSIRRFILIAFLLMMIPWAVMQVWLSVSPSAFDVVAPEGASSQYIEQDFEEYYSNQPSQNFASQVFLNNIRVGFFAFAAGVLACVVTAMILIVNGANVGVAGGLFTHVGQADKFWGLILPHGLLELSAVIVAGAAGLRIGWTVIAPGDRTRFSALTQEARRAGNVLVGLVVAFLLAAMVEGFVTGKPWPTSVRVGIGVTVFVAFWGLTIVFALRQQGASADDPVDAPGAVQSLPEALSSR